MKFGLLFVSLACIVASPALAWSGSATAGDYRITATLDDARLRSISLASDMGVATKPMHVHAWFIDSEGALLAQAPLAAFAPNGVVQIAYGKGVAVPAAATALVVLAQPAGLTRTAAAAAPALVAQIALP